MSELEPDLRCVKTSTEYRVVKQINKGSYGDVFLAERLRDGRQVCLKQVDLDFISASERLGCLAEVKLLLSVPQHPHIVTCYGAFWEDTSESGGSNRLVIALEYGDAGDLDMLIQHEFSQQRPLPVATALQIFAQIVRGLDFLHQHHIIHRDIKSKNVFRFSDGRVVIGDFGTCKSLASTSALANTLVGSPLYMSPELLEDQPYSFSSDVWSLGCLLYELFTGRTPFAAPSYPAVVLKITKGVYDPLPLHVPDAVQHVITKMLRLDPKARPTPAEILKMDFMASYIPAESASIHATLEVDAAADESCSEVTVPCTDTSQTSSDESLMVVLPQPPPTVLTTKRLEYRGCLSESPPLPPPPPVTAPAKKKHHTRVGAAVFPTTRASVAHILSRERLQVHREHNQQSGAASHLLSCVPVLDTTPPFNRVPADMAKPVKRTAVSAKPRVPLPPDNMMIIGTKVANNNQRVNSTKPASPLR